MEKQTRLDEITVECPKCHTHFITPELYAALRARAEGEPVTQIDGWQPTRDCEDPFECGSWGSCQGKCKTGGLIPVHAHPLPSGMRLVPEDREPVVTERMLLAAIEADHGDLNTPLRVLYERIYRAMLAAAPVAGSGGEGE